MARKQKITPSIAPLTAEIANAIVAATKSYAIENRCSVNVEWSPAADEMTDNDHIYITAEGCQITLAVGTGEIPYPGNPIQTNSYGKVMAYGYILEAPGTGIRTKCHLNGKLELDYSKPEAKINADIYVDMLNKAIHVKKAIEAALAEEIC